MDLAAARLAQVSPASRATRWPVASACADARLPAGSGWRARRLIQRAKRVGCQLVRSPLAHRLGLPQADDGRNTLRSEGLAELILDAPKTFSGRCRWSVYCTGSDCCLPSKRMICSRPNKAHAEAMAARGIVARRALIRTGGAGRGIATVRTRLAAQDIAVGISAPALQPLRG